MKATLHGVNTGNSRGLHISINLGRNENGDIIALTPNVLGIETDGIVFDPEQGRKKITTITKHGGAFTVHPSCFHNLRVGVNNQLVTGNTALRDGDILEIQDVVDDNVYRFEFQVDS